MKHEQRIRALIDRYEAAQTSPEEEQELRMLLRNEPHLAEDLRAAAVLFDGMAALGEEQMPKRITAPATKHRPRWAWVAAAAALVAVVLLVDHLRTPYCYIDGKAIYDPETALAQTDCLARLEHLDQSFEMLDALLMTND